MPLGQDLRATSSPNVGTLRLRGGGMWPLCLLALGGSPRWQGFAEVALPRHLLSEGPQALTAPGYSADQLGAPVAQTSSGEAVSWRCGVSACARDAFEGKGPQRRSPIFSGAFAAH